MTRTVDTYVSTQIELDCHTPHVEYENEAMETLMQTTTTTLTSRRTVVHMPQDLVFREHLDRRALVRRSNSKRCRTRIHIATRISSTATVM